MQCNVGEILPPEGRGQLFSGRVVKIHQFEACGVEEGRRPRQAIDHDLPFNHQHLYSLVEALRSAVPIVLDLDVFSCSTRTHWYEEAQMLVKSSSILFIYRTTN